MSNNNIKKHEQPNYSIEEAAIWLGVHHNTVRNLIKNEDLGCSYVGSRVIISSDDLDALIAKGRKSPSDEIQNNQRKSA